MLEGWLFIFTWWAHLELKTRTGADLRDHKSPNHIEKYA